MTDRPKTINTDNEAFTDIYADALNSLERGYLTMAREDQGISDGQVDLVLEHLIRHYKAAAAGKPPRPTRLKGTSRTIFDNVVFIAEVLLGHGPPEKSTMPPNAIIALLDVPLTYDELIACLRRIRKSIRFWSKQGGRRSYLNYVLSFTNEVFET